MSKRGRPKHPDILTPREWEVLELIREGLSNVEIGSRLGISIDGVKYHVTEILGKLELENRHQAAAWTPDQRPWWESAVVLLSVPRPRVDWLSPVVTGALAVVIAVAVGLLVWALLAARGDGPAATAVALPTGDRVAYVDVGEDLWVLGSDGAARKLTDLGAVSQLRWSPDGRYVLFLNDDAKPADPPAAGWEAQFSLWLAEASSDEVRRLTRGPVLLPEQPWAPQSDRITYLAPGTDDDANAVWIAEVNGSAREVVSADFGALDIAWSPDGERLAVARRLPPIFAERIEERGPETTQIPPDSGLYLIRAEGGEPEPLALVEAVQRAWEQGEGQEPGAALGIVGVGGLQWSPDGLAVAFQASTLSASFSADGEPLFTVPVEGGPPVYHGIMLRSRTLLDWFPGGHRFVFTLGGGRDIHIGKQLAVADAGVAGASIIAEEPRRLPTPEDPIGEPPALSIRSDAWPAVSPDSITIAFQASEASWQTQRLDVGKIEGPREGIWIVEDHGEHTRQLTSNPEYLDFLPRWSADGELIMFLRTDGLPFADEAEREGSNRAELWLVRADGSDAELLLADVLRTGSYYGLFGWEDYVAWWRR